jgi:type IV secretion system protein TrbL
MARAAGGAATNAARHVAGRASSSLKQSADAGRRGAWTATGGTPTASMSEANTASASAPSGSASANAAPEWANRLRSEQAARAHRQTATQAIKDGDRPGNGANPSLNDKDD